MYYFDFAMTVIVVVTTVVIVVDCTGYTLTMMSFLKKHKQNK